MGRSRERQRRSRRAVLGGLLVFAIIQAAVALLIELRFPGWRGGIL